MNHPLELPLTRPRTIKTRTLPTVKLTIPRPMTYATLEPRTTRLLPPPHLRLHLRMEVHTAHPPQQRQQRRRTVVRWRRHTLDSRRRRGGALAKQMVLGTKKGRQVRRKVDPNSIV